MYNCLLPLIKNYPHAKWLTVGDGRFGTDANYLIRNNIKNVLATSLSDSLLKKAKEDGFIYDYKVENAEKMSFEDDSFDFAFCKESYHHFPRPMLALYELLRVAKKGVIIIEPNDENIKYIDEPRTLVKPKKRWQLIKDFIKAFLKIKRYDYNNYQLPRYEPVGNYVYSTSEREFEKVVLGLNFPTIAFKGLNDFYIDGVEFEQANEGSALFTRIKDEIETLDNKCTEGNSNYNILVSIFFKINSDENTLAALKKDGFRIKELARNPYLTS